MKTRTMCLPAVVCVLCAGAICRADDYRLEEREKTQRTVSGATALDVNNVNGFIHVTGDSGNTVRLDAEKIMRARDSEEMARAKREVTLDINQKDGVAQFYVNGPFRDHDHASSYHGFHESESRHYDVTYNLTLRVPRAMALTLKTVNGEVNCADTSGKFEVNGVNGSITMNGIAGSGSVRTVNGPTTVSFRENPKAESDFHSVNGKVEVTFQPNLDADIRVKTFNGAAYTDFDSTALASQPAAAQNGTGSVHGRWVYLKNQFANLRVGKGGPELTFETLNGDIRIRKAQ
jgi:hypothetical protein